MLSVIMLKVMFIVMLNVVMQNAIKLNVVMPNAIILRVVMPIKLLIA